VVPARFAGLVGREDLRDRAYGHGLARPVRRPLSAQSCCSHPSAATLARWSCSARTVASSRWTSARIGAPVPNALRHRASLLPYRFSSRAVSWPIGRRCSSCIGSQLAAVVLLGYHRIELDLQGAPHRRNGVLGVPERDGPLKVAPVVAKLECCERIQRVLRRVYCRSLLRGYGGGHRPAVLTRDGGREFAIQRRSQKGQLATWRAGRPRSATTGRNGVS
jgi:hypothetical protein